MEWWKCWFKHLKYSLWITLKRKNLLSPTPDACCALLALRSIQLMTGKPRPPVQRAPVTWREWGLWCCVLAERRSGLQRFAVCGSLVGLCSPVCERHLLGSGDNNNQFGVRVTPSRFIRLVILPVICFKTNICHRFNITFMFVRCRRSLPFFDMV